ncbi:MAG: peptidylprolyl isomerase [Verrucomicrobiae bacterium]
MKAFYFILGLTVGVAVSLHAQTAVVDGVKGVVSARVVTFSEVEDYSRPAADTLRRQYSAQPDVFQQKLNDTLNDSLEQLVERALILKSFDTDGYKLPEAVVDELMQERIRERFGDRVTFMKTLQAQGMTVEQFRKQVREQYIESALRNQNVQREVFISPYKIESYYKANPDDFRLEDQIKLRMIVLTKSSPDDTNVIKLAREIQAKIKDGTPFTEMAAIYSQGSQQHQGGDWGWVQRSVLRKELADIAFTLTPGTVSDLVDTSDTCYLMFVEDKHASHVRPLLDVATEIEKILRLKQQAKLQKDWIEGLKKKTFIRYF